MTKAALRAQVNEQLVDAIRDGATRQQVEQRRVELLWEIIDRLIEKERG